MAKKTKYKIMRYSASGGKPKKIKGDLTLKQAQKHCNNPKTRGKSWFHGYTKE